MICSCCSLQKRDCERITPVDLYKRANMSNLLRLFITKEQRQRFALFHEWKALLLEDVRCVGSLVAQQTSGAEVPGLNLASPTMILGPCRIIV